MGIRCDQYIGLNARAKALIAGNQTLQYTDLIERTYPDGSKETLGPIEVVDSDVAREPSGNFFTDMFGDEYPLYRHALPDGRVMVEFLQEAPCCSGPCHFLALKDEKTGGKIPESLWTEEEIEEEL